MFQRLKTIAVATSNKCAYFILRILGNSENSVVVVLAKARRSVKIEF